jgi:NAD(P)-dependent dehydrogenase (short-subunit alcohol dehydrogenase family)
MVVVADVSSAGGEATIQQITAIGGTACFIRTDVSVAAEVSAMIQRGVTSYGRLDYAFNNAGINDDDGPAADCSEALWDRTLAVNLCHRLALPR